MMPHLHFSHLTPGVLIPSKALKSTQINTGALVSVLCLISCLREMHCVSVKLMQKKVLLMPYQLTLKGGLFSVWP